MLFKVAIGLGAQARPRLGELRVAQYGRINTLFPSAPLQSALIALDGGASQTVRSATLKF